MAQHCIPRSRACSLVTILSLLLFGTLVFRDTSINQYMALFSESPAPRSSRRYAIATVVLSRDYEDAAMALCMSIRSAFANQAIPSGIELIAYIPEDAHTRGLDVTWLTCCFQRVKALPLVTVSQPPSFERFKEQYIKLNLWNQTEFHRLLYLDADFVVARIQPLLDLVQHAPIPFGAVQDWNNGAWSAHWNGGLLLLEPSLETYRKLASSVEPFIRDRRFNTDMAEQGYLSAYFDHVGFTLPTTYNLNLAIKYQAAEEWERYASQAIAIHFTWVKPWQHPEDQESFPASLYWAHRQTVDAGCPRPRQ